MLTLKILSSLSPPAPTQMLLFDAYDIRKEEFQS